MIYQEVTTYSPMADADVTRVSTSDSRGAEFFSLVRRPSRNWKAVRDKILDAIEQAMLEPDAQPGEVAVDDARYRA